MYKQLFFVPTLLLLLAVSACNSEKKNNDESTDIQPDTSSLVIKTILYTVPSPFETAMLIKRFDLAFKPELVLEPKHANQLVAEQAIAVNLGIYYTDACYAAVNNEMHLLEKYFEAISKLTLKLKLAGKIQVPKLSSTPTPQQRSEILQILSESYLNTCIALQTGGKGNLAALTVTGGWIESGYLYSNLINNEKVLKSDLTESLLSLGMSLQGIMSLIENNDSENGLIVFKDDFSQLNAIFDKLQQQLTVENTEKLKTNHAILISDSEIEILTQTIIDLRNKYGALQ